MANLTAESFSTEGYEVSEENQHGHDEGPSDDL